MTNIVVIVRFIVVSCFGHECIFFGIADIPCSIFKVAAFFVECALRKRGICPEKIADKSTPSMTMVISKAVTHRLIEALFHQSDDIDNA